MEALVVFVLFGLALVIGFLYLRNIFCLISLLREGKYSIVTGLRGIGIFFPLVGIIMGLV